MLNAVLKVKVNREEKLCKGGHGVDSSGIRHSTRWEKKRRTDLWTGSCSSDQEEGM